MLFEPENLQFSEILPGKNGRKPAAEYYYAGHSILVYPQVFPFGGSDQEDISLHYSVEDEVLSAFVNDEEWLSGALAFFEQDYPVRIGK